MYVRYYIYRYTLYMIYQGLAQISGEGGGGGGGGGGRFIPCACPCIDLCNVYYVSVANLPCITLFMFLFYIFFIPVMTTHYRSTHCQVWLMRNTCLISNLSAVLLAWVFTMEN